MARRAGAQVTVVDTDDQTFEQGRAAGQPIANLPPAARPDAVFAGNDLLALGLMQALVADPTISIPIDIALYGYALISPVHTQS